MFICVRLYHESLQIHWVSSSGIGHLSGVDFNCLFTINTFKEQYYLLTMFLKITITIMWLIILMINAERIIHRNESVIRNVFNKLNKLSGNRLTFTECCETMLLKHFCIWQFLHRYKHMDSLIKNWLFYLFTHLIMNFCSLIVMLF